MKQKEHQQARNLYMQTDLTQQQIADLLDVDRRTIYDWIKKGHWEEMKIAARRTPMHLGQNLLNHIDQVEQKIRKRPVEDRCPTMEEIEMLRKLYNMLDKIAISHIGDYVQTYDHLLSHIAKTDFDLCRKVVEYADEIIEAHCLDQEWELKEDKQYLNDNLARLKKEKEAWAQQEKEQAENIPTATAQEQNEIFAENDNCPGNPLPAQPHEECNNAKEETKTPISDFSGNETINEKQRDNSIPEIIRYYASLPADQRPSPFRFGDTLWVNNIDDVDNRLDNAGFAWGERKMGDTIRRYSDIK